MEYSKPHLSLSEQAALLIRRGLEADVVLLATRLRNVGYCRFCAYLHPFLQRDEHGKTKDALVPGTTLDKVWSQYLFDRQLRFMLLDAIERIEVALRSRIAHHHTKNHRYQHYPPKTGYPYRMSVAACYLCGGEGHLENV